jgi:N-succinyldiaminopimelate aminotransferase
VPLIPPEEGHKTGWSFDAEALRGAFTAKTRMILLNHPHNPTGKIFSAAELQLIAAEVKKHSNVVVVSDEVYEHMVRDLSLMPMMERSNTLADFN